MSNQPGKLLVLNGGGQRAPKADSCGDCAHVKYGAICRAYGGRLASSVRNDHPERCPAFRKREGWLLRFFRWIWR